MADPILVLGGGPAAALATLRLAQSNLPVRAIPGPQNAREDSGIDRLGPLPDPDPILDTVAGRRIRVYRHCFAGTGPAVTLEFRDRPGGSVHRLLQRGDLSRSFFDAARARGATVDDPGEPVELRREPKSRLEVRVGSESLHPPLALVSDPTLLPQGPPPASVQEWIWQAEFPLAPERIEARFGIESGEGALVDAILPSPSPGVSLGGFLRTGPTGLAAGVILRSRERAPTEEEVRAAGAHWQDHPLIAPILSGTRPERESILAVSGRSSTPPWSEGCLPIGRAAGLLATNGLEPRGLGAELASAELATRVLQARPGGGLPTPPGRARWNAAWRSSGAIQELKRWDRRSDRFKWGVGLANTLPNFLTQTVHELLTETGAPKRRVGATVEAVAKTGGHPRIRLLRSTIAWMEAL